ncbi:MAG: hypothetical protein JSS34_07010 [Proteobacteria bacterium]|nr:hypothetical protein [Pseudomonadota bacterium]
MKAFFYRIITNLLCFSMSFGPVFSMDLGEDSFDGAGADGNGVYHYATSDDPYGFLNIGETDLDRTKFLSRKRAIFPSAETSDESLDPARGPVMVASAPAFYDTAGTYVPLPGQRAPGVSRTPAKEAVMVAPAVYDTANTYALLPGQQAPGVSRTPAREAVMVASAPAFYDTAGTDVPFPGQPLGPVHASATEDDQYHNIAGAYNPNQLYQEFIAPTADTVFAIPAEGYEQAVPGQEGVYYALKKEGSKGQIYALPGAVYEDAVAGQNQVYAAKELVETSFTTWNPLHYTMEGEGETAGNKNTPPGSDQAKDSPPPISGPRRSSDNDATGNYVVVSDFPEDSSDAPLGGSTVFSRENDDWDSDTYNTKNPLQPHIDALYALGRSNALRWADLQGFSGRFSSLITRGNWPKGRSLPLTDEKSLSRLYGFDAFFRKTGDTFRSEIKFLVPAYFLYEIISSHSSLSIFGIFIGESFRDLNGIPNFSAKEAVFIFFTLPVLRGAYNAFSNAPLGNQKTSQSIRTTDLSLLKETSSHWLWNDLIRASLVSPPLHGALRRLVKGLLWDDNISEQEALNILESIYAFSQSHNALSWMSAVEALYKIVHGVSVNDFDRFEKKKQNQLMTVKAKAYAYLLELEKNPNNNWIRNIYLDLTFWKLGLSKSKTKSALWVTFRVVKGALYLFLAEGTFNGIISLASSSTKDPSQGGSLFAGSELNNTNTIQEPNISTTVTTSRAAPPPPSITNASTKTSLPPTVTSSAAPPPPPPAPPPPSVTNASTTTTLSPIVTSPAAPPPPPPAPPAPPATNATDTTPAPTLPPTVTSPAAPPPPPPAPPATNATDTTQAPTLPPTVTSPAAPPPPPPAPSATNATDTTPATTLPSTVTSPAAPPPPPPAPPATNATATTPATTLPSTVTSPAAPPPLPPGSTTTTVNPLILDSQNQLVCLNAVIQAFNTFPGQNVTDAIGAFKVFSNLPSEIDLDLSGKGLSGQTIAALLIGFNATQPNVKLRSVNLSGNIVANNAVFQSVLLALPSSLQEFIWQFDESSGLFNPSDALNFTTLKRFSSLTHLDLGGWYLGNVDGYLLSLSQTFPFLSNLTYVNMSSTHMGQQSTTETSVFLTTLFKSCQKLQTALFSNNLLGTYPSHITALQQGLQNCSSLQTLLLDNNRIGFNDFDTASSFLQSLKETNIATLNLRNNYIGSQNSTTGQTHANVLATSLPITLTDFDISGNYLSNSQSDPDFRALASGITNLPLRSLYIARQSVNAAPINTNFTDALRTSWTNHSLSSQNTDLFSLLSPADVTAYFNALSSNATTLDFSQKLTPQIYSSVASAILNLPNATKASITKVDISGNNNMGPLIPSLVPTPFSQLLAPAIGTLSNLKELHIENNGIVALLDQSAWANATAKFPLLRKAYFQGNSFGRGDFSGLGSAFNQTKSLTTFNLGSDPNLSNTPSPIASLGSSFSFLTNFTTFLLDHSSIFGATSSAPTSGANLFNFFRNLQSAFALTDLNLSFNLIGKYNVSDGVYVGNTLRSLRNMTGFDISYNPIDALGSQGAQAIVDSILFLHTNGKLKTFNLAASMTLPSSYWTQNQAAFRNITNPIILGACPAYLSALLNVTNSSSSAPHQRRSLSELDTSKSAALPYVSASGKMEGSYGPASFKESADSESVFGSEILSQTNGNTPPSISEDIEPAYAEYATSGASSLQPPQPFRFISSLIGSALQYWRGAPPSLSLTAHEWEKMQTPSLGIPSSNASLPEKDTQQPTPKSIPLNGTASINEKKPSKDTSKDQKKSSVPRPDSQIKEPYVKTFYNQIESGVVTGLWLWTMAEKWAEWMLEEPEEITDGIPFESEHKDRLRSALKKAEPTLWTLSDSKDQSTLTQFEDLRDILTQKLSMLSKETVVSKAELTRFERNLALFKSALKDEENSLSYSREFNHKRAVLEEAFKTLFQTLEFMKTNHQMGDEALQEHQKYLESYHRMFLNLESIPELHMKKQALREIKQNLDTLSLSLNIRHALRNLSSLFETLKKDKRFTEDDFTTYQGHITKSEEYLLGANRLFDVQERNKHLTELKGYLDSLSEHLEVEYTLKDISALLDTLRRVNEISERDFNSYQFDLTRLARDFQDSVKSADPVEKQKKLSELKGKAFSLSRFLQDTHDITVPETYSHKKNALSNFVSLHQKHAWIEMLLKRFSSTLDFLRAERSLPQAEFEDYQTSYEKHKASLLNSEGLFNFQEKKDHLEALKAELDKALKSLQKKHALKAEEIRFPVNDTFSSFVPFYKERLRVEHIIRNLAETLETLRAEKKMSLWHLEAHLEALERHNNVLSNIEKLSQASEKHTKLKELKESLFFLAERLEDQYGIKTPIDVSALPPVSEEQRSFSQARLWVRHFLENISDALQTVFDQKKMMEGEYKEHQTYLEKARHMLLALENISNTQKRQSDLKRLKDSLEVFSKYLKKTYHVKVAGPFSFKTVEDPVGPEESLRNLFVDSHASFELEPSIIAHNTRANIPAYLL